MFFVPRAVKCYVSAKGDTMNSYPEVGVGSVHSERFGQAGSESDGTAEAVSAGLRLPPPHSKKNALRQGRFGVRRRLQLVEPTARRDAALIRPRAGFSLVEILVAIAAIGVLATVGIVTVTGVPDAARKKKLDQDVAIVNNAIDAYLLAGGDAAQLSEGNVINALKQRVAAQGAADIVGPQGPFLDPTVITMPTDFSWSALYTTDPTPRFYVAQVTTGVIFGHGPAMAVGGAAERPDAARPSWVWTYTDATAPTEPAAFVPTAIDGGYTATNAPSVAVTLAAPVISPGSQTLNLWGFPLQVSIANPNPSGSSRVYYKAGTGNYTLYDNTPFNVDPETTLSAVAVSLDPSRFYNSSVATATYSVTPLELAVQVNSPGSVTYAQAGGLLVGVAQQSPATATITLENTNIPAPYLRSANFNVRYTTDGSDPLSSGTATNGAAFSGYYSPVSVSLALAAWGTNTNIVIRAAALAANTSWFVSSPVDESTVTISPTVLPSPTISPAAGNYAGAIAVTVSNASTNVPSDITGYYTTNGSTPAPGNGVSFSTTAGFSFGPFAYGASGTVKAVACGPASYSQWFTQSIVNSVTYTGPNYNAGTSGGVLISGGAFANNSIIRGSVIVASVATGQQQPNLTLANNGSVTGNVYLPGTPTVTGIATNRIINLDGPITPTNYTFTVGNNGTVSGNVYRRITPTPLPTVTNPTGLVTRSNQSSGTLLPGAYNTVSPNNGATITLGIAGATNPAIYSITNFSVNNNARVNIVGPVILTLDPGASKTISIANNVVLGNVDHPEWLQLNMYSGNLTLGNNGYLYAAVKAPTSTVTFENNTVFRGSVTAKTFNLENNGAGIVFTLAPPQ